MCFYKSTEFPKRKPFCDLEKCTKKPINLKLAQKTCSRSEANVIKTIRIESLEDLIEPMKSAPDLKIIYYIRDPRGMAKSRLTYFRKLKRKKLQQLSTICDRYRRNFKFLKSELGKKLILEKKIFVLRYEDFGGSPFDVLEQVYDFFELNRSECTGDIFAKSSCSLDGNLTGYEFTRDYLKLLTTTDKTEHHKRFGTQRNSSSAIFSWVGQLDFKAVRAVQKTCGADLMEELGYRRYATGFDYGNGENVLGRNSLMTKWLFGNKFYTIK